MPGQEPKDIDGEGRVSRGAVRGFSPTLLQQARTRAGWTLEDLALRSGVERGTIGGWETSYAVPSARLLAAVAQALGLQLSDLTLLRATDLRVADLRARLGLTQQDVVDLLGISSTTLGAVERGYKPAKPELVAQLCGLYGITEAEFEAAWDRTRAARLARTER